MSDSPSGPPSRPSQADLDRYAELFNQSINVRYFGAHIAFPEGRKLVVTLPGLRPEHRGGLGSAAAVNGGIIAAIFDLAIVSSAALVDPSRRCATIQLSMSFERALTGEGLRVEAEVETRTTSLLFATARAFDGQGRVCARCQGVVKLSTLPWPSGDNPAIS